MKNPIQDFSSDFGRLFRVIQILVNPLPPCWLRRLGNFFRLAQIPGWPYLHFWSEYPPFFHSFLRVIFLPGRRERNHFYATFIFCFDPSRYSKFVPFYTIVRKNMAASDALVRTAHIFSIMLALPYSWWYFEPLVVPTILAALLWILGGKASTGGLDGRDWNSVKLVSRLILLPVAIKKLGWKWV